MMTLEERVKRQLDDLGARGLKRTLSSPRGIDLSSNDYLGLAADDRLKTAFIEGVRREGIGSTGSRLLRGERNCFTQVERKFSGWKGTEASLYFATGYQANIGILQTFLAKEDVVISDQFNHASLIDGIRLSGCRKEIFRHLDVDQLAGILSENDCKGQKYLVTESLFSMDGDIAPLDRYAEICEKTNTNLIVDEAHAVGIYGNRGSGLIEDFGVGKTVFLSVNTAGKALGSAGAFVSGKSWAIDYLINSCRSFIFSTAPPPAVADVLEASIEIVMLEPERRKSLFELSRYFREQLAEKGFQTPKDTTHIIPILIGESDRAVGIAVEMQSKGFDVRAIRPPTVPEGTARLRVSLNVNLTEEILEDFVGQMILAGVKTPS